MTENQMSTIFKWTLRLRYASIILAGISALTLCCVLMFTSYEISKTESLNSFAKISSGIIGLIFVIIGLIYKAEVEHGIRLKWHEKEYD